LHLVQDARNTALRNAAPGSWLPGELYFWVLPGRLKRSKGMRTLAIVPAVIVVVLVGFEHYDVSSGFPELDRWVAIFVQSLDDLRRLFS